VTVTENCQLLSCHLPLSTPRFFVLLAFSKPKKELHKVALFRQENVQQACKMLSVSTCLPVGRSGAEAVQSTFFKKNKQPVTRNPQL